jgi:transposase
MSLHVWYERCAGLDVHKLTVVACVLLTAPSDKVSKQVRTFATTTAGLQQLATWLESLGVTHAAMESTGIYWRPVFNLLESRCEVILVNAQHLKAVPGHKTDMKDSEWIADLLRHGLLTASFIPPKPIRDLGDLVRSRKTLVQQRAQAINRVQKVLETAHIKLSSVASDVLGKSGRDMLDALSVDIEQHLAPYHKRLALLMQIPGIGLTAAAAILAEIGTAMGCFASAKHLASWAGVAPGNKQRGGKRLKAHTNKGNTHLRAVLAEVVWVISHTQGNSLSAQYHRLARRIGKKRAIVAVSHSLLTIIYHMLLDNQDYHDLGPHFFETLDTTRQRDTAVRRLQALGYKVTLEECAEVGA